MKLLPCWIMDLGYSISVFPGHGHSKWLKKNLLFLLRAVFLFLFCINTVNAVEKESVITLETVLALSQMLTR